MSFGADFSGVEDLDANLTFLEGDLPEQTALAQAIARRLNTPTGGNPFDPSYGYDLRQFIGSSANPATVAAGIEAEARKDERIDACTATINVTGFPNAKTWTVTVACTATSGKTFTFTIAVSAVSVTLLNNTGP